MKSVWLALLAFACTETDAPRYDGLRFMLAHGDSALSPPTAQVHCPPGEVLWFWEQTGANGQILATGYYCGPPPWWAR